MIFKKNIGFSAAAVTNMGKVRTNNEDNLYFDGDILSAETVSSMSDKNIEFSRENAGDGLFCVCDGMGGESYGELASLIAVTSMQEMKEEFSSAQKGKLKEVVGKYVELANTKICEQITKLGVNRIGTTYVLAKFIGTTAYISNIGDSRAYLIRKNSIRQLNRDHTEMAYYVAAGLLTEEEARKHPRRHGITQHLGIFPDDMELSPYFAEVIEARPDDVFILCSDGLTDMLDDSEILSCVRSCRKKGAAAVSSELVAKALKAGGNDNVTVISIIASRV